MTADPSAPHAVSEADVDARVVVPYLAALGLTPPQIRAQRTFTLRLGRQMVIRGNDTARATIGGRLDYLITNAEGDPLFVVELKAPGVELTDDDRDQGISYARLLDRIAPFVLVTNGHDSRLYDSITRSPLGNDFATESAFYRNGRRLATTEDLAVRAEALESFVGYSAENVRLFSEAQRTRRLQGLRGEPGESAKKYLPATYVRRAAAHNAVDEFMSSDRVAFVLVGASGVGKTNEACAQAERLGNAHLVLFFSGPELHGSLGQTIADEFGWHFAEELSLPRLCQRLARLANDGRRVVLVIDAVDEADEVPGIERELSSIASHLSDFGGRVKLLVTAKTSEWMRRFASFRGQPAPIRAEMFRSGKESGAIEPTPLWSTPRASETNIAEDSPSLASSFVLSAYTPVEVEAAVAKYEAAFTLDAAAEARLGDLVRDPFLLRVFCEVARRGGELPRGFGERALLAEYLRQVLARLREPETARLHLEAVGRALLEHAAALPSTDDRAASRHSTRHWTRDADAWTPIAPAPESVPEEHARRLARGASAAPLDHELFAFGLLTPRETLDGGRSRIAFVYDRVRDYVVALWVLGLGDHSASRRAELAEACLGNPVGEQALAWYLQTAPPGDSSALGPVVKRRMTQFVEAYSRLRDRLAEPLRTRTQPAGEDKVGVAYHVAWPTKLSDADGSIWIAITPDAGYTPRVRDDYELLRSIAGNGPRPYHELLRNREWAGGVTRQHPAIGVLRGPERAAAGWFLSELHWRLVNGYFVTHTSPILAREAVVAIADANRKKLGLAAAPEIRTLADHLRATDLFPLDLRELDRRIQLEFATFATLSEGIVPPRAHAEAQVALGRRFEAPRMAGPYELVALHEALSTLLPERAVLEAPVLPGPDRGSPGSIDYFTDDYSDDQLARYVESFVEQALQAYDEVIAANLPALRPLLPSRRSNVIVVSVRRAPQEEPARGYIPGTIDLTLADPPVGVTPWMEVRVESADKAEVTRLRRSQMLSEWKVPTRVGPLPFRRSFGTSFSMMVRPYGGTSVITYQPGEKPGDGAHRAPIRNWVLNWILEDLESLDPAAVSILVR